MRNPPKKITEPAGAGTGTSDAMSYVFTSISSLSKPVPSVR
jgi:hypothetical protein